MNAAGLLRALEAFLRPRVEQAGGRLDVSATPDELLGLLGTGPNRWRLILQFASYGQADEAGFGALQRLGINAVVQAGRAPGETEAHRDRGGEPPLLERVDSVIGWMRQARFRAASGEPHPEVDRRGLRFLGGEWLELEGLPTRQFQLRFELTTTPHGEN